MCVCVCVCVCVFVRVRVCVCDKNKIFRGSTYLYEKICQCLALCLFAKWSLRWCWNAVDYLRIIFKWNEKHYIYIYIYIYIYGGVSYALITIFIVNLIMKHCIAECQYRFCSCDILKKEILSFAKKHDVISQKSQHVTTRLFCAFSNSQILIQSYKKDSFFM